MIGRVPTVTREDVLSALGEVLDPELPVSVVDLGLVTGVDVQGSIATIRLTYTSLGCPCTEMIQEDVRERAERIEGIDHVIIEESLSPWGQQHISARGLEQLRDVGIS